VRREGGRLCGAVGKTSFLAHGLGDGDIDLLAIVKVCLDLIADIAFGDFDVVLGSTFGGHQAEETIIDIDQLVLSSVNVGDVHVVGGGAEIFILLLGEDINADQVDFGVTVLARLGGTHIDNLAGTSLDEDVATLAESRALHGEAQRRPRRDGGEFLLVDRIVGHGR